VFAGTLGVQRALDRERDALRGLLLAPLPRQAILAAKAVGIASLLGATALGLVPLVAMLFAVPLGEHLVELAGLVVLGALGTAILGALVAVAAARTRGRHVLVPVLLFPLLVPLLIAGVRGTAALVETPSDLAVAHYWLRFLGVFDAIFAVLCLWIFEPVVAE
jgi:ABC-type transport system involved in cytochrome c biogenesis permease component